MESCQFKEKNANVFNADKFKEKYKEENYGKIEDKKLDLIVIMASDDYDEYLDEIYENNLINYNNVKKELR